MECRHFGVCGSCRNFEGGYEVQLQSKKSRIQEMFAPYYDVGAKIAFFRSPTEHYRARAEFKVWHVSNESHYAMNALEGKGVVLLEECPKVLAPIGELMFPLLNEIKKLKMQKKLFNIDFLSSSTGEIVVSLLYHRRLDEAWSEQAKALVQTFGIHVIGRSRKQKIVIGQDFVTETLNVRGEAYRFQQIENSFTQPNPRVNEQMLEWALEQFNGIGGDLLELYCGAGNFTIPFASRFERVLATEISKSSITAAKNNMKLNNVTNIDFVRMSAEEFVQALDGVRVFRRMKEIDLSRYTLKTLFVDPPRAGLDDAGRAFAARHENLLYISCNPETLRRDLDDLSRTHKITSMALFDQFPYTDHLEMGVMLVKKGIGNR